MSDTPKLNPLASKLFAKNAKERKVPVEVKAEKQDEEKDPVPVKPESSVSDEGPEPMEVDKPDDDDVGSSEEDIKLPIKSNAPTGRKPLPIKHRGAVGAIRLNQSRRESVYRKTKLFRLVNQVVRKELKRQGIQFSRDSVAMIATAMENIMYRKAAPGQLLSLSGGKSSLMLRHAALGIKINRKPDLRQWNSGDFKECDVWLERSQFRDTELDVIKE